MKTAYINVSGIGKFPGLPDGLFSKQKSHFGLIFEGLAIEDVGIFYTYLVQFQAIWHIL
jgi:hypothetical protein